MDFSFKNVFEFIIVVVCGAFIIATARDMANRDQDKPEKYSNEMWDQVNKLENTVKKRLIKCRFFYQTFYNPSALIIRGVNKTCKLYFSIFAFNKDIFSCEICSNSN